eukprot:TRINITY_DN7134_c0_g2_i1.p1 TRINITY_DN7134_c0_g2~~TRINITY_DN7134_c0_g2_i1.p1  ORF type:complete len:178 (+),score=21.04 TRINITY_DN7134_c0_g2_i1:62-535(+)
MEDTWERVEPVELRSTNRPPPCQKKLTPRRITVKRRMIDDDGDDSTEQEPSVDEESSVGSFVASDDHVSYEDSISNSTSESEETVSNEIWSGESHSNEEFDPARKNEILKMLRPRLPKKKVRNNERQYGIRKRRRKIRNRPVRHKYWKMTPKKWYQY